MVVRFFNLSKHTIEIFKLVLLKLSQCSSIVDIADGHLGGGLRYLKRSKVIGGLV